MGAVWRRNRGLVGHIRARRLWFEKTVLALVLALLGSLAVAQVSQVGNALFKLPEGWRQLKQGQLTLLLPPDFSQERKLAIVLTPAVPLVGDFRQGFEESLKGALAENEELLEAGELQQERSKTGFEVLGKLLKVQEKGGSNPTLRLYLGARVGERLELAVIIASSPDLFEQYQAALQTFTQSWTFTDLQAARPAPQAGAKPLQIEGLYVANILQMRPKAFGIGYEYANFNVFWLLLPGGQVYFGLPQGDPAFFDLERARREQPAKVGSYRLVRGQVQFSYRGVPVSFPQGAATVPLGLLWPGQSGKTVFRRVEPCDHCRLSGSFARRSFSDVSSALGLGNVSGEVRFVFSPDGRFEVSGFTGFAVSGSSAGAAGSSQAGGRGTYSIQNNLLQLLYQDGRREQAFFFRFPGEENTLISINGSNYLRQQ